MFCFPDSRGEFLPERKSNMSVSLPIRLLPMSLIKDERRVINAASFIKSSLTQQPALTRK